MRKFFVIISVLLVSAAAASAQTAAQGERSTSGGSAGVEKKAPAAGRKTAARGPGVVRLGPSTTYLKNGLKADEVVRFLGRPDSVVERLDGDSRLVTYTFARGAGRVLVAEFENGTLVSSRTQARDAVAHSEGEASGQ
jgi:hypothetical protein